MGRRARRSRSTSIGSGIEPAGRRRGRARARAQARPRAGADRARRRRACAAAAARGCRRSPRARPRSGSPGSSSRSTSPGRVGGAVRMNANAYDGALAERARLGRDRDRRRGRAARPGRARASPTAAPRSARGEIVARARFALRRRRPEAVRATIASMRERRHAAQPKGIRTFGSTFKNPPGERPPGSCSPTPAPPGCAVGGARFSRKHANFVENTGDATTADIVALMALARERVLERFGDRARARGRAARRRSLSLVGDSRSSAKYGGCRRASGPCCRVRARRCRQRCATDPPRPAAVDATGGRRALAPAAAHQLALASVLVALGSAAGSCCATAPCSPSTTSRSSGSRPTPLPAVGQQLVAAARSQTTTDFSAGALRSAVARLHADRRRPRAARTSRTASRSTSASGCRCARVDVRGTMHPGRRRRHRGHGLLAARAPARRCARTRSPLGGRTHDRVRPDGAARAGGGAGAAARARRRRRRIADGALTIYLHRGPRLIFGDGALPHAKWDAAAAVLADAQLARRLLHRRACCPWRPGGAGRRPGDEPQRGVRSGRPTARDRGARALDPALMQPSGSTSRLTALDGRFQVVVEGSAICNESCDDGVALTSARSPA